MHQEEGVRDVVKACLGENRNSQSLRVTMCEYHYINYIPGFIWFWFQSSRRGSFRQSLQDVFLPWYNAYRFLVQESIIEFWVFGVVAQLRT